MNPDQIFLTKSVDSLWKKSQEWVLICREHPITVRGRIGKAIYLFLSYLMVF